MTTFPIARWLTVAIALLGLAFAIPVVGAHGDGAPADGASPGDGTAAGWADWMRAHMTSSMGPGAVEWMDSHMGVTVEEMAGYMFDDDHDAGMYGRGDGC